MKHYRTLLNSTYALALGALLAVGLNGCTADELVEEPGTAPSELGDVTVIATLGQGVGTRTGHEESTDGTNAVKVTWATGDDIKIVSLDGNQLPIGETTFTFSGMNDAGTSGIFKGKAEPVSSNYPYSIVYPARADTDMGILFDMTGQTQWGNGSMAHLGAYDVMGGMFNDWRNFTFTEQSRRNALMTFDLKGLPADLGRPQSITMGCTSADPVFSSVLNLSSADKYPVPTLELKLTGFTTPTEGTTFDIKAYLMMVPCTIPAGEKLTITVKGDKNSYTFNSAAMGSEKKYTPGKRYTATVEASAWEKVFSGVTYTGTETAEDYTGSGTSAADPYVIATAGQLRKLIENVKNMRDYSVGKFFRLASDIRIAMASSVNDGEWQLIGTVGNPFAGTFDGDGHTISGSMTSKFGSLGFFGHINGATIRNLTVDAPVYGRSGVGGVAGNNIGENSSYIINCINKGTVTAISGISGGIIGNAKKVYIFGCVNQGDVSATTVDADYYGGIAGQIPGGAIVGCYNTATVTAAKEAGGGIAGGSEEAYSIMGCYNTGKVKQIKTVANQLGAITGRVTNTSSSIKYCQYVLDAENAELPIRPGSVGASNNAQRIDLNELNGDGVADLNTGIRLWNTANTADATKQCLFHFVPGTATTGPTLEAGAPTN